MDDEEVKTEYWREATGSLTPDDYPEVDEATLQFPKEIYVAFAVCRKGCGRKEFIVDGSTQICQYCGKMMFRIRSEKYVA